MWMIIMLFFITFSDVCPIQSAGIMCWYDSNPECNRQGENALRQGSISVEERCSRLSSDAIRIRGNNSLWHHPAMTQTVMFRCCKWRPPWHCHRYLLTQHCHQPKVLHNHQEVLHNHQEVLHNHQEVLHNRFNMHQCLRQVHRINHFMKVT